MFIEIIQKRYEKQFWDNYDKLAERLKGDFDIEITGEDLYYHYSPHPLELDAELNWKLNA
jgi:hypothetical protein